MLCKYSIARINSIPLPRWIVSSYRIAMLLADAVIRSTHAKIETHFWFDGANMEWKYQISVKGVIPYQWKRQWKKSNKIMLQQCSCTRKILALCRICQLSKLQSTIQLLKEIQAYWQFHLRAITWHVLKGRQCNTCWQFSDYKAVNVGKFSLLAVYR